MGIIVQNIPYITLIFVIIVVLVSTYQKILLPYIRIYLLALKLKTPKTRSIAGHTPMLSDFNCINRLIATFYKECRPIFSIWIFFFPMIAICEPEHIQLILGNSKHMKKVFVYSVVRSFLGDGLVTNEGVRWKSHRKYMQSYYNVHFVQKSISTFLDHSENLVQRLKDEKVLKIIPYIIDCVQDIVHSTILGIQNEDSMMNTSPFRKTKSMAVVRFKSPLMLLEYVYNITSFRKYEATQITRMRSFVRKVLEKRKNEHNGNKQRCVLDNLIVITRKHPDFTEEDVIDEIITSMLAGNDAVSSTLVFTLHYLAKNKEFQCKARTEVDEVLKQCNNNPDITDLNKMKYLTCCIKEAMRMSPTIPYIGRVLSEDVKIDNYILPAGCSVVISPYITHRLSHLYPNPEEYDPDRFSVVNENKRHPYAFIPFSAGPRICIGYKYSMVKMKTILAVFLHRYDFSLESEDQKLHTTFEMILHPRNVQLKLERRF